MLKKLTAAGLAALLLLAVGCNKAPEKTNSETPSDTSSVESVPEPTTYTNPLTGIGGYEYDLAQKRPIAIMINNMSVAQPVQTGVNQADIVYETEVEGGITRLMAVYQDLEKVDQIGTVRSARYPYVDLALSHKAFYVHCGCDPLYCKPHLKDIDDCDLNVKDYGKRISNGLAREHTLYVVGNELWQKLSQDGTKLTADGTDPWQNFAPEDEPVTLTQGACTSVSVPFSQSYNTTFTYNAETGLYTRFSNGTVRNDYRTGASTEVKNVFVLMTSISDYPDGYHRKVELSGGSGFYMTGGNYTPITWKKASANAGISFFNPDGSPLTINAGHSWVCIADSTKSQPVIQ